MIICVDRLGEITAHVKQNDFQALGWPYFYVRYVSFVQLGMALSVFAASKDFDDFMNF